MIRRACLLTLTTLAVSLTACKNVPASDSPDQQQAGEPEPGGELGPKVDSPKHFALTDEYACRIEAGAVMCWGGSAPLPGGDQTDADGDVEMPIEGVTAIAIDDYRFCGLNRGGVQCWGHDIDADVPPLTNSYDTANRIETLDAPKQPVAMSAYTESGVCVLGRGGDLRCWAELEIPESETEEIDYMMYAEAFDVAKDARMVKMGPGYACWVAVDGTVACAGLDPIHEDDPMEAWEECLDQVNEYGCDEYEDEDDAYCGSGEYSSQTQCDALEVETVSELWASPSEVGGIESAVEVATGLGFACARLESGVVQCWGRGPNGEMGTGRAEDPEEPIDEPIDVKGIDDAVSLAAGDTHACVVRKGGSLWCWGDNAMGQLGEGDTALAPRKIEGFEDLDSVVIHAHLTCAIAKDGATACFGSDAAGRVRGRQHKPRRHRLASKGVTDVRLAMGLTCLYAGTEQIGCVGKESFRDRRPVHERSKLSKLDRGKVVEGTTYGCGITDENEVRCWQSYTQMKEGGPSRLVTKDAVSFSHDNKQGCAATKGGEVTCWWQGTGDSPLTVENVPGVRGAVDTASTNRSTCALMKNGDARCFSISTPFSKLSGPLTVSKLEGLTGGIALDATSNEFCALTNDNKVHCWPSTATKSPPLEYDIDATAISMSSGYTCAIETAGTVACWGHNRYGNVSPQSTDKMIPAPTRIADLRNVVEIETSPAHACARTKSGAVECWGRDFDGELARQPNRIVWPPAAL